MSLGLILLGLEALAVYGMVFAVHAARDRFTLVPYFALLGTLAATLRWTTDAGILYHVGPLTFMLGSVVFFTSILLGVFLLYLFDGVQATQISIYVVVAISILSPAVGALFEYQRAGMVANGSEALVLGTLRVYVASTAAMILDFLFMIMAWELLAQRLPRLPLLVRIAVCLLSTYWMDSALFCVGAFWGEAEFWSILEGNLLSRAVLTVIVAPLLTFYVAWEEKRQHHEFTPRSLMAILYRSARRELDLFVARRELEERKRAEEALRRRDAILKSLAFAAEHVPIRSGEPMSFGAILESLGTATGVNRVRIAENIHSEEAELMMRERFVWQDREPVERAAQAPWTGTLYRRGGLIRWEQALGAGEAIEGDLRTFPQVEQHALLSRGITSILVLPVKVAEIWWGFISFEACGGSRTWPASEIDALRTAAGTLGAAIQRARMEEILRESEERLELALQGGDLGLWDWDVEQDHVVFNERWAEMLGFELHEIEPTSRTWERLIHPEDLPRARAMMHANLKGTASSIEVEIRMRARSGEWRWILNKGKVVSRDRAGRVLRATGTHLDITRLKETEAALRYSQEMFQLMFDDSPMGLILCNLEGRFVRANPAFRNLIGYSEDELRNRTYFDVTLRGHEQAEQDLLASMVATGRYGPFETEYVRRDGALLPVISNGCLVTGTDGKQYIWSIVEDVGVRKAAEQAIAAARSYQHEVETQIEETLLRGRVPDGLEGVDVAVVNVPTEHLDGDFTDFVPLNRRCFDVLVGDVMGKGILAALVSAGAKGHFLRALSTLLAVEVPGGGFPTPGALVGAVHAGITRQLIDLDCFLTLCYARFDLEAGSMTFVDCGHTKTIRFRAPDHTYTLLQGDNVPIGFLETESYVEQTTDLRPGDIFFFYSDGLTDSRDGDGAMFGVDRLVEVLQLHASLPAVELTAKVLEIVRQFTGYAASTDDMTCVAVKILDADITGNGAEQKSIAADVGQLADARSFLQGYLDRRQSLLGSPDEFNRVVLAYVEALSNVIRHSLPEKPDATVDIVLRSSRNRLEITICHDGVPFKPRSTPLPNPSQKHESGYGLYIMNKCFNQIGYETTSSGGQNLVLVKHFQSLGSSE